MHATPYANLGEAICRRGGAAFGLDLPGHGRALATKSPSLHELIAIVRAAVTGVSNDLPAAKLAIVGDSAGGTYSLAASPIDGVQKVALLAPGLLPRWHQLLGARALRDGAELLISGRLPLLGWRVEDGSRSATFIEQRRADPLALSNVDRRYVWSVARAVVRALISGAPSLAGEVRIWHGTGDKILSPLGSRILMRRLRTADASLRIVSGGDHGLLWDPEHGVQVTSEVADWLCEGG